MRSRGGCRAACRQECPHGGGIAWVLPALAQSGPSIRRSRQRIDVDGLQDLVRRREWNEGWCRSAMPCLHRADSNLNGRAAEGGPDGDEVAGLPQPFTTIGKRFVLGGSIEKLRFGYPVIGAKTKRPVHFG
jgi:hypothetical protein